MQYSRLLDPLPTPFDQRTNRRTPLSEVTAVKKAKSNGDVRLLDDDSKLMIFELHAE